LKQLKIAMIAQVSRV